MTDLAAVPVVVPDGFFRNPDCDRHGAADLVTRPSECDGDLACIDVWHLDDGRYSVALNAGLYGNTEEGDYPHLVVSEGYVQKAVDLFAERSRSSPGWPL